MSSAKYFRLIAKLYPYTDEERAEYAQNHQEEIEELNTWLSDEEHFIMAYNYLWRLSKISPSVRPSRGRYSKRLLEYIE